MIFSSQFVKILEFLRTISSFQLFHPGQLIWCIISPLNWYFPMCFVSPIIVRLGNFSYFHATIIVKWSISRWSSNKLFKQKSFNDFIAIPENVLMKFSWIKQLNFFLRDSKTSNVTILSLSHWVPVSYFQMSTKINYCIFILAWWIIWEKKEEETYFLKEIWELNEY